MLKNDYFDLWPLLSGSFFLLILLAGCPRFSPSKQSFETETLNFKKSPSDLTLAPGSSTLLRAVATASQGTPVSYVWEKLQNNGTVDVSQNSQLEIQVEESGETCIPKIDTYRLVANAGPLRKEKSFTVTTRCPTSKLQQGNSDDIEVKPGHAIWLMPNESVTLRASSRSSGSELSWYALGAKSIRTLVSNNSQYQYTAPALADTCEVREMFFQAATSGSDNKETTTTISVHVQNPKCVFDEASGLGNNDTTKLLIAKDDSVYLGTKKGLTRISRFGQSKVFNTAGNNKTLQIVTALAEANSEILVGKARQVLFYPVKGFGIERLSFKNNFPLWNTSTLFEKHYASAIFLDPDQDSPLPYIVFANNYARNGGVLIAADTRFAASSEILKGESLYAILDLGRRTLVGGDGGLFLFEGNEIVTRYDGSQWGGKSGIFGAGSNRNVRALAKDNKGFIWVGLQAGFLQGGGLVKFRPNQDATSGSWSNAVTLPDGNDVRALVVDSSNRLWIATNKGLTLKHPDGSFETFGVNDGLPSADIRDLALDTETRNLWIATGAGAARWSLALLK